MEDDDEFGDLYTDVLRPFSSSSAAVKPSPDPLEGAGGAISVDRIQPFRSASNDPKNLDASPSEDGDDDWLLGRAPPAVEPPKNWNDDDDDEQVPVRPREEGKIGVPKEEGAGVSKTMVGDADMAETKGFGNQELDGGIGENMEVGDLDQVPVIPGLAAASAASGPFLAMNGGDSKPSASEDWDSDSEDDLQIVLNDNNHGLPGDRDEKDGIEDDDDEDGEEDLVIVTGGEEQHRHLPAMDDKDWGEEGIQAGGDVKDLGEVGKGSGVVGSAPATRIGYNNHGFHAQHHSMFKYVRPGAAPVAGSPISGAIGLPGQARPSLPSAPIAGRGRGDWRPAVGRGMTNAQKGFPSSYGAWTNNLSSRTFGGGLDFSLPPHKTVFDVEIDGFEEKPWRHPGVDMSDFFNFGLDEEKWKDYCKQLDQLRLESTMQSKIRVYESGRSEQEYDPDLPPELAAAAAGHHDILSDSKHHGKADTGLADFNGQGRGLVNIRPPLPTGRAIQVEGGYGERLPSIDTRPPRMRDADAIIEIVLEDSLDDPSGYNGTIAQPDKAFQGDRFQGSPEVEEVGSYVGPLPRNIKGKKREATRRPTKGGDLPPFSTEAPVQYPPNSKPSPIHGEALNEHCGERSPEGISRGRHSSANGENSDDVILCQPARSDKHDDHQRERLVESTEINGTLEVSPSVVVEASKEPSIEDRSDAPDDKLASSDSVEAEGEDANSDIHISNEIGNDSLVHSGKKQKLISHVEHPVIQDNCDEDGIQTSHSDNSRANSGSSKEYQRRSEHGEEVMQDGHLSRTSDSRRHRDREEHNLLRKDEYHQDAREFDRSRMASKGKEDMYHPYAHRDIDSTSTHAARGRSFEKPRETDVWHRREDNIHSRRVEEIRREQSAEASSRQRDKIRSSERNDRDGYIHPKKRMDDGDWRGHSKDGGSRQRERDDIIMSRRDNLDDSHIRRKKDEENAKRGKGDKEESLHGYRAREDSSRSKRERDDGIDQRRREDSIRMRDKVEDHYPAKHKDDGGRIREKEDRPRHKQPHENTLLHREREEGRGAGRSARVGSARDKEDSKSIGFEKDYQEKGRRQNERSKRDRSGEENAMHHKGHGVVHPRDKQLNDERGSRHERTNPRHDRPLRVSDGQQIYRERNSVSTKKLKEPIEQITRGPSKGRHEDSIANHNKKGNKGGTSEQESSSISSTTLPRKGHTQFHRAPDASLKQGDEDLASDDENLEDLRRGRSKLERWTSHDERDYITIDSTKTFSTSVMAKEVAGSNLDIIQEGEVGNAEGTDNVGDTVGDTDVKGGDAVQIVEKMGENQDRNLDRVAKLKRRSERFKPLLQGEEMATNRKVESELQTSQNEAADMEVKLERPARKRRWTGS